MKNLSKYSLTLLSLPLFTSSTLALEQGSTATGLDQFVDIIQNDEGLKARFDRKGRRKVTQGQLDTAAQSVDRMNHILIEALYELGLEEAPFIAPDDVRAMSAYIQEHYMQEWQELHGQDLKTLESGFHFVRNDGASSEMFGRNALNVVADGIYHLGFGTHEVKKNRLATEKGGKSVKVGEVSYWLTKLLAEDFNYDSDAVDSLGRTTHDFYTHASHLLGSQTLSPTETGFGGGEFVEDLYIEASSPITGLRPVIEQAIDDIKNRRKNRGLTNEELESKIAKRLTNLNDFRKLKAQTKENLMILAGVDFEAMSIEEREASINHLLHSPLPFGEIDEVLDPQTIIDLGYTHTLSKKNTRVSDLGGGVFQVWLISNNGNGSHTGHNLGSFKVQLEENTTAGEAKALANQMVRNTNNNNELQLAEGARSILYGEVERLDYSHMSEEEKLQAYKGKALGDHHHSGHMTNPEDSPMTGEGHDMEMSSDMHSTDMMNVM